MSKKTRVKERDPKTTAGKIRRRDGKEGERGQSRRKEMGVKCA